MRHALELAVYKPHATTGLTMHWYIKGSFRYALDIGTVIMFVLKSSGCAMVHTTYAILRAPCVRAMCRYHVHLMNGMNWSLCVVHVPYEPRVCHKRKERTCKRTIVAFMAMCPSLLS